MARRLGTDCAVRPRRIGGPDGRVLFRLETKDGAPADPPKFESAVPDWRPGRSIYFGDSALRVVGVRDDDADQPPVLIVEEAS